MTLPKAVKSMAIAALVLFLAAPALAAEDPSRAVELLNALGCKGCHRLSGEGGTLGPALDGVGKRMNKEKIRLQLIDPKAAKPDSMMPSYAHLSEKDIDLLAAYLGNLR